MPVINTINTHNGTVVSVWEISETVKELIDILQANEKDLASLCTFKLNKRKLEFLATRILIKQQINTYPDIEYLPSGKPILKNSPYKISITHTKGYAAVIFSKDTIPGIDIEYPSERVLKISERFISPSETNFINSDNKVKYYSLIWCIKETMYKIIDKQGVIFNEELICKPFKMAEQGTVETQYYSESAEQTIHINYIITPNYYLVYSI